DFRRKDAPRGRNAPISLTHLTDDEQLLRDSIREFADAELRPRARAMDEQARLDPDLLPKLFDLGVMATEVPESFGGSGGTFFHAVLVVEELSRVDPAVGVIV